jgi:ubiquinone/menaquinone biosynthesis C-methylase UbiE
MSSEVAGAPRSQYVDFWNTVLVPKFVRSRHILVCGLTLHSAKIFPSLAVREGDAAVDAGCGFGDTAVQLARLVGPSGSVLGVDCCDGFLDYGRQYAKAAGLTNVKFLEADVQNYPFQSIHDFCFSRFGTQFFENPGAGLRNMRKSLRPDGTMTMTVWRGINDNPWLGLRSRSCYNICRRQRGGVLTTVGARCVLMRPQGLPPRGGQGRVRAVPRPSHRRYE